MSANVAGFAHSAWAGFAAAFGPLPSASNLVKNLVETLGSPNPEKWKQLGDNFGRMAGANLKPLAEDLAKIAGVLRDIASIVPSLKTFWEWTGGMAVSGYKQYEKEHLLTWRAPLGEFRPAWAGFAVCGAERAAQKTRLTL